MNDVSDDLGRFLDACAREHDRHRNRWHRTMLAPPGPPRTDRCMFCGTAWDDIAQHLGAS